MAAVAGDVKRGWSSEQPCWTARRRRCHIVHQKIEGRARNIRCGEHGRSSSRYFDDQTCWRDRAMHCRRTSAGLWQSIVSGKCIHYFVSKCCTDFTEGTTVWETTPTTSKYTWLLVLWYVLYNDRCCAYVVAFFALVLWKNLRFCKFPIWPTWVVSWLNGFSPRRL